MIRIAIIGAGGGSRDVLEILEAINQEHLTYDILGFIVDPPYAQPGQEFCEKPVLGGFDWLSQHANEVQVICGVGASELRYQLIQRAKALGVRFCTAVHPSVILSKRVSIGEGTTINAGCVLTNQIQIGHHVQINVGCTISHDVMIQDYATLSPGVHLAGNVTVNEGCFIGIGAVSVEKKTLGTWSIIGAGSVIVDNVLPNTTVVGVPGKVIKSRTEGWHLT